MTWSSEFSSCAARRSTLASVCWTRVCTGTLRHWHAAAARAQRVGAGDVVGRAPTLYRSGWSDRWAVGSARCAVRRLSRPFVELVFVLLYNHAGAINSG
uniref:Secreted protein n=1 Tax=Plectus sambesii TaxID=2011161 RepID=A0A914XAH0_9BILA